MTENPFEPPQSEQHQSNQEIDYDAKKRSIIVKMFVYFGVLGVIVGIFPDGLGLTDFALQLPELYWSLSWCFTDAKQRGHRIGRLMRVALVLFFLIAFPVYLLQTRGIAGFKAMAIAVVLAIGMVACMIVTANGTFYFGVMTGLRDWPA